jgi:hypothetical protein
MQMHYSDIGYTQTLLPSDRSYWELKRFLVLVLMKFHQDQDSKYASPTDQLREVEDIIDRRQSIKVV